MPGGKGHLWSRIAHVPCANRAAVRVCFAQAYRTLTAALLLSALVCAFPVAATASGDAIEVKGSREESRERTPVARSAELAGADGEEAPAPEGSSGFVSGDENEAAKVLEPTPKSLTLPLAEDSLYVEAYDSLTYDRPKRTVVLDGNALMVMSDIQVEADHIEINDLAKNAYLKGNIAIQQADDVIFADEGYLSYETRQFELINVSGNTSGPMVNGIIYFRADEAKGGFDDFKMHKVWLTTCPPTCTVYEYELTAKDGRMQRDKVLMLYRVYVYAREHKIMFLPQLAIPLKRFEPLRRTRSPIEQNYGYNQTEGFFAKYAYTYDQNWAEALEVLLLGMTILDITEKKGTGFGLRQDFATPLGVTTMRGKYQQAYRGPINEATQERGKPDTNYALALSQELNFGRNLQGTFSIDRDNTYRIYRSRNNTMGSDFNLSYTGGSLSSTLTGTQNMNISGGYTTESGSEVALRKDFNSSLALRNTFNISRQTKLTVNPSMRQRKTNDGLGADLEGEFMSNLNINRKDYTVTLTYQESPIDLDGDRYTKDNRIPVNNVKPGLKLHFPRTTFSPNSPITDLDLELENVTKKLRDETDIGPTVRFKADTGLARSFGESHAGARLSPSLNFAQYMYSDGNAQYVLSPSARLDYDDRRWLKGNFSWGRTVQHGVKNPPVRGEAIRSRNNANFSLNFYQEPVWDWRLSSSYDFISRRWGSVNSTMDFDPGPNFGVTFSSSYSIESQNFQPLSSNWSFYSPADNWYLRVNLTTPLQGWSFLHHPFPVQTLTWTYSRQYKRGWNFYLYGTQSGSSKGALFDRVQIQKRNTCTTLNFGYIGGSKTYYMSVFINAFPSYPLESFAKETAQGWDYWLNVPTPDVFSLARGIGTGYGGYSGYSYGTTGSRYGGVGETTGLQY